VSEPVNILQKYRIGELDQRVQIMSATETQSGSGAIIQTWAEYATRWASVTPTGGNEVIIADAPQAISKCRFVFRYDSGIDEKMRLVWDSHSYNSVSREIVPRNRFLIIIAQSSTLS
jgi:SPP1 family predicted phage head-tail adaptor